MAAEGAIDFSAGMGAGDLDYNPFLPEIHQDPYPFFHRLRAADPVHWNPPGMWILTRHSDAVRMLRHPHMGSDFRNSEIFQMYLEMGGRTGFDQRQPSMLFRDPPDHTRLRNLVTKAFSARVIEGLRPFIARTVDELLDRSVEGGEFDVVTGLAYPLPVRIICEMLGVPPGDDGLFAGWSEALIHTLDPMTPPEVIERGEEALAAFDAYFLELIAERRRRPRDDLLTALLAAEEQGERLTEEELLTTLILLLVAGHETTVNLISNGALALLDHPDELRRLREDPSLIRTAIEELLRFDPPVQLTGRVALEDVEFGGKTVRRGQHILALTGAANRDPLAFPHPDRLDLGREDNRHVAFGGGIHFCLGATLARVEGQAAIGALAARFPALGLAGVPERRATITLRGLKRLPVRFDYMVLDL